jgi:MoaA/NifB/PqqE/SkfB family radical SAM enzyme
MNATLPLLEKTLFPALKRRAGSIPCNSTLGYRCNQSCLHCHVNAGPQAHGG